jgi:hypothetical protein
VSEREGGDMTSQRASRVSERKRLDMRTEPRHAAGAGAQDEKRTAITDSDTKTGGEEREGGRARKESKEKAGREVKGGRASSVKRGREGGREGVQRGLGDATCASLAASCASFTLASASACASLIFASARSCASLILSRPCVAACASSSDTPEALSPPPYPTSCAGRRGVLEPSSVRTLQRLHLSGPCSAFISPEPAAPSSLRNLQRLHLSGTCSAFICPDPAAPPFTCAPAAPSLLLPRAPPHMQRRSGGPADKERDIRHGAQSGAFFARTLAVSSRRSRTLVVEGPRQP